MGNPMCPECGKIMYSTWCKTVVGEKSEGRAKFWKCKCGNKFKIGAGIIRKRGKFLSEDQVRSNLGLGPKPK